MNTMNTKTMNEEKTAKVIAEIEFVAIAPWGWASGSAPATAIRKVRETYVDHHRGVDLLRGREVIERDIFLWIVEKDQWDRIIGEAPANKDGAVGICLYGFIEQPEWRDQIYEALSEAYEKWATAAV